MLQTMLIPRRVGVLKTILATSATPRRSLPLCNYRLQSRLINHYSSTFRKSSNSFLLSTNDSKNSDVLTTLSSSRFFSSSAAVGDEMTVQVPDMGDSINEGGLVEWVRGAGQYVEEDDVVCVMETDKVSLDVRSDHNAVIVQTYGEPGDTVEVGQDLFVVRIVSAEEASANSDAPAPPAAVTEVPAQAPAATPDPPAPASIATAPAPEVAPTASSGSGSRIPLIRFRHGARSEIDAQLGLAGVGTGSEVGGVISVEIIEQPSAMFARKSLTEDEISAIISGGASQWN